MSNTVNGDVNYLKNCGIFLVGAAVLLGLGYHGMQNFLGCCIIQYPTQYDKWTTPQGFTHTEFVWLVISCFSLPIAFVCAIVLMIQTYKGIYSTVLKLSVLYSLLAVTIWVLYDGTSKAHQTLQCGIFCVGSSRPELTHASGTVFIGFLYMFAAIGYLVPLVGIIVNTHLEQYLHPKSKSSLLGTDHINYSSTIIDEKQHRLDVKYRPAGKTQDYVIVFVVFIVMFPLLVLACMALPTWWAYFDIDSIRNYQVLEPAKKMGYYFSWRINDNLLLKLFPDILLFYGTIYVITIIAFLSQINDQLRLFLHSRCVVEVSAIAYQGSITIGEILLCFAIAGILIGQFSLYYYDHWWQMEDHSAYTLEQSAARAMGQVANACMGLLLFPISRNNIWSIVFGVSWEAMLHFHRYMGGLFVCIVLMHVFLWWKAYAQMGYFPHDIFAVPMKFHADNFTVPLAVLTTICTVFVMIPFANHFVRRWNYNVFYFVHHFFMIFLFVMLWHATMGWYYITAGLILWSVDHFVRISNSLGTDVIVTNLGVATDSGSVTHLSYQVRKPWNDTLAYLTGISLDGTDTSYTRSLPSKPRAMAHEMGQYCYINIPQISLLEWHPFTISSAPQWDSNTSHHIKNMGETEWTGKLLKLAKEFDSLPSQNSLSGAGAERNISLQLEQQESGKVGPVLLSREAKYGQLAIAVDGPYGVPIHLSRYTHLLLVAGGIGVTPIHSYFRCLYLSMKANVSQYSHIQHVRMVWNVRELVEVAPFKEIMLMVQEDDLGGRISFVLHITQGRGSDEGNQLISPIITNTQVAAKCITPTLPDEISMSYICQGRVSLLKECGALQTFGPAALVFVCGPSPLVNDCSKVSEQFGIGYAAETFEF